jgi:hypothetical protein
MAAGGLVFITGIIYSKNMQYYIYKIWQGNEIADTLPPAKSFGKKWGAS